jgi:hypothetical protein
VPKSDGERHEEQQDRVANVVASVLRDADADLYNWADEAVRTDAMQAVYALAKLAAAAMVQQSEITNADPIDVLRTASAAAFGRTPAIR